MLTELMIAAVQGVSHVLADRFIAKSETSASIRSVVEEVTAMREMQSRDRATLIELKHLMTLVLERADGLEVHRREIQFTPTENTPDAQAALLNLDLEIEKLRMGVPDPVGVEQPAERAVAVAPSRVSDPSSIFYQLDEEIAELRRGERGIR